jgi:AraC-like DNA-binding protein
MRNQHAGFFDQSHFSKTFKLLTGQSPAGIENFCAPVNPIQTVISYNTGEFLSG